MVRERTAQTILLPDDEEVLEDEGQFAIGCLPDTVPSALDMVLFLLSTALPRSLLSSPSMKMARYISTEFLLQTSGPT